MLNVLMLKTFYVAFCFFSVNFGLSPNQKQVKIEVVAISEALTTTII